MDKDESHLQNTIMGVLLGALIGAVFGMSVCFVLFDETPLIVALAIVVGALICGTLGFMFGESFIEWLKENWDRFWW